MPMKMEATCSFEMLVNLQWTTQHYIPKTELLRNYNASTWLLNRKLGKKEDLMCDNHTV
jgi:hypothetical protein